MSGSNNNNNNNYIEVNGTESDVAFGNGAFEGNFSYSNGDLQELNYSVVESVVSVEEVVNSSKVESIVAVQEVNSVADVNEGNGTEFEVLPVTFDALEDIFSYKNDENLVRVQELSSSMPVQELKYGMVESVVPVQEANASYVESVVPVQELKYGMVESTVPVQEVNSSVVESIVPEQELYSSVTKSFVPVHEVNSGVVESIVHVQEVNSSAEVNEGNGTESEVLPVAFDALEANFSYNNDVQELGYSQIESVVNVQEMNASVEVNGTESVTFDALEGNFSYKDDVQELDSRMVESIVPVQGATSSVVESVVPVQEVNSSRVESIISTDGVSPTRGVPIEGPEGSNSLKSPHSTALNDVTLDDQESIENKSSLVTPGNVGRGKLERFRENGVRRSPRLLSPVTSSPQIGGKKKDGSKLKRIRSSVDEVNVEGGNGSCEKVELTGSSDGKKGKRKRVYVFVGEPVPEHEAQERWGWRYELKNKRGKGLSGILNAGEEDEVHVNVECHYLQANVNGCIFSLGDCAHIKGEGKQPHVGRIVEFFKTTDDENYFRVQWFFRAEDTVMKEAAAFHDKKRLFYSTLMNDNLLECILSKVKVIEKAPMLGFRSTSIQPSEYYCDMEYSVKYSTFRSLVTATDNSVARCDLTMPSGLATNNVTTTTTPLDISGEIYNTELTLLDLYAGCGGMSTGLCLGSKLSGVKLVTRWAIDYHKSACDSLKLNHPETEVRHTTAEDFLELLKEWEKLCKTYILDDPDTTNETSCGGENESRTDESSPIDTDVAPGEYEVSSLVDICFGDPSSTGQYGLKFKVRWKGYDPSDDTWEPIEALSDCQGTIQSFVRNGYKSKILPCPGDVDVICGGPPCQGISGYNRFRNTEDPLNDEKNQQIIVFFDIVKFLNPKYVLMENVGDILRFDKASLGRYAISRLVHMNYQARLGIMAAGSYGLPQFRLRVFLWGAHPNERLPQFPLPTHEVIVRYFPPAEFEQHTVAYDEGQPRKLQQAAVLRDAISDLPPVTSHEVREEITYEMPPETEFQKYIRLTKDEMTGSAPKGVTDWKSLVLTDHRPYKLSEDDFHRVCYVPRKKGANFRDFPGIVVGPDNKVHRGPANEQVLLPSGRPLIPEYVFTFEKGKSKRPFARVWWDENVATVVTYPNLHSQAAVHPEQDRVLTMREYARLQGFPDHYRFCGTIKERYCQVGNAVAVSVSKTLGYALGMAFRKLSGDEALMTLPPDFAYQVPPLDQL
ncbi:hypothetical protein M8C21_011599 [Ambrosia artemisiifolia]|uniref:Cytosine-specific methyltransferase n=1 Tax=Ambrosia artemisiifolia TaxID=4212 RepID=A0AAD5CKM4_AMBAR|nr:hypothetical protein M8C21_011599 [Ambrosia artemisiifolia]